MCQGNCCGEENFSSNNHLEIGQAIVDFPLDVYHKEGFHKTSIASFRGKWAIFFFYPADFTFVCPTELEDMAAHYAEFQALGTEVISVSTDTVFAHKAWHDMSPAIKKIEYPMAADPTGDIARSFGVYIDKEGLALRGSFIVDPDGVLQAYEVHANNIGRSATELLRKLEAAIFVRAHGDQVCPANWKAKEKTLKPGIDLVGKI